MQIPNSCQKWAQVMARGQNGEDQILRNLQHDKCIDGDTANEFFKRLAAKGVPSRPEEAKRMAQEVIREDPDAFVCRGPQLPNSVFAMLFRLEDLKALRWRVPDCLKRLGIVDEELIRGLPGEELATVTDEYHNIVSLGNHLGMVWATDYDTVQDQMTDLEGLIDRLGLVNLVGEHYCVVCVYSRGDLWVTVRLPRSCDALNYEQFELVEDCKAESGQTKPLTGPPEQGLPEAVHKKYEVTPEQWELGAIK
jgi:hypothetical protein